jgi:hypothetical protein
VEEAKTPQMIVAPVKKKKEKLNQTMRCHNPKDHNLDIHRHKTQVL